MTTEELTNLRDALVKAWVLLSVRLGAFGLEAFALHLSSLYQDDLHFRADCEKLVTAFIHGGIEDLQGLELNGRETVNLFCRFFFAEKALSEILQRRQSEFAKDADRETALQALLIEAWNLCDEEGFVKLSSAALELMQRHFGFRHYPQQLGRGQTERD